MLTCQGKLGEPGVMDVTNDNQQMFEGYTAMTDKVYGNLNSKFVDNQKAHGQMKNSKTDEALNGEDTEPTEQGYRVHESNLASGDFIAKIPTDEETAASISKKSLNKKRIVFHVLHQWATNYVSKFTLTQFIDFYLVAEAQESLTWSKQ